MLDGDKARLTTHGVVQVSGDEIIIKGFEGEGAGCREVAVLGMVWAIGELQRELLATLEEPGSGNSVVD